MSHANDLMHCIIKYKAHSNHLTGSEETNLPPGHPHSFISRLKIKEDSEHI